MRKKYHYQRAYKGVSSVKRKKAFQTLTFLDKKIYLDDLEVQGVNEIQIKKSSTSLAELNLKMTVLITGLDFAESDLL